MKIPVNFPGSRYFPLDEAGLPFVFAEEAVAPRIRISGRFQPNDPRNPWMRRLRVRTEARKVRSTRFFLVELDGLPEGLLPVAFGPQAVEDILRKNPRGLVPYVFSHDRFFIPQGNEALPRVLNELGIFVSGDGTLVISRARQPLLPIGRPEDLFPVIPPAS